MPTPGSTTPSSAVKTLAVIVAMETLLSNDRRPLILPLRPRGGTGLMATAPSKARPLRAALCRAWSVSVGRAHDCQAVRARDSATLPRPAR